MINRIMESIREQNDTLLRELLENREALQVKNEEEAFGHLHRVACAVRAGAKEMDRNMDKVCSAMLTREAFEEKVNGVYSVCLTLSAAAQHMALVARQIYEQTLIYPGARAGMTPMETLVEEQKMLTDDAEVAYERAGDELQNM